MSRPGRVFFEGAVYHVYNRLARGESVFDDEAVALRFRDLLLEVAQRDGLAVFAWCLMSNHYHLAVRTKKNVKNVPVTPFRHCKNVPEKRASHAVPPLWYDVAWS